MNRAWKHIRHVVASMMLVAVASFVLHAAATTRAAPISPGSASHAVHPDRQAHDHGVQHVSAMHAGIDPAQDGAGDAPGANGPANHGCGICCQTAIVPVLALLAVNRVSASSVPLAFSTHGRGIAHEGLRRPPRPADIA